jgi:hypothetical protein
MDQQQAEKSLEIIRSVIENTRDDLIERNWGLIWIVHSFINFACCAGGTWIDRRELPVYWYAVPLLAVAVLNIVVVLFFMSRERGVHSYVEWQLWAIWVVFVAFTLLAMIAVHVAAIRPAFFALIFAMNCGICFAMMGIVFYRRFLFVAGVFLVTTVAAAFLPAVQWWLIGATWWLAMFPTGLSALIAKAYGDANMSDQPESSDAADAARETDLAVLVACHYRSWATRNELTQLIPAAHNLDETLKRLVHRRLLDCKNHAYGVTQLVENASTWCWKAFKANSRRIIHPILPDIGKPNRPFLSPPIRFGSTPFAQTFEFSRTHYGQ